MTLALGGEFDIASGKELKDGFTQLLSNFERIAEPIPNYRPLAGSVPSALAGTNICMLNYTPPSWAEAHILRYSIGINDDHTVAASVSAALYAGDPWNPTLSQCLVPGRPVFDSQFIGKEKAVVHSGEYLFWILYSVAANATIWTNITVAEYAVKAREWRKI